MEKVSFQYHAKYHVLYHILYHFIINPLHFEGII
nr:MAG TPA: hypothetical protein [Caudoviricetes sp.]